MSTWKLTNEKDIATAAAYTLQESFIIATRSKKVLYVENDILWSKTPHGKPVLNKKLSRRNPNISKIDTSRGTFKIKKWDIEVIIK